ncbi:MAG: hypothetical protein ABFD18_13565 [Syntrophomonas sp.]
MPKFFEKVEKYLIRSIVLGFVLMIIVQGLMTQEPWRMYLSWNERMEGQNIEMPASTAYEKSKVSQANVQSPQAMLTISLQQFSSLPKASILVNGNVAGHFNEKEIKLQIDGGDVLEIDSTLYNFPVNYHIESVSENMAFPKRGADYTANQSIVMIGKVIVK